MHNFNFIQDYDSLALSSPHGSNTDLDPLVDSFEAEFGYNFTDVVGRRSNITGQSRRLHRQAQPSSLATTSARATTTQSALGRADLK